jgi:ribosomal protein L37AE/L43A
MTNGQEDFAARYAQMGEMELMELAQSYDRLLENAQAALRAEFARRGLEPPEVEEKGVLEFRSVVTLRRYRDLAEAMVARAVLESAGIEAWIADENFVRMDWFYSNMVGGMRLQVAGDDETAAREILEQDAPRTITYGEDETYEQPICPKCGAHEITLGDGTERGRSFVGLWAAGIPLPPRKAVWHCDACGAQWVDTEK